jgi:hypothetical protein
LDIERAFDNTSKVADKQAMFRHDIPDAQVDWTENMLAGRKIVVYQREKTTECTPDRGCPQGGVLSPLLWCYGYADDIAVVAGGCFLTALRG